MEKPQTWFCQENVYTHIYSSKYRCEFFIYVVAYQPSSYTELMLRQRLMLKITL